MKTTLLRNCEKLYLTTNITTTIKTLKKRPKLSLVLKITIMQPTIFVKVVTTPWNWIMLDISVLGFQ